MNKKLFIICIMALQVFMICNMVFWGPANIDAATRYVKAVGGDDAHDGSNLNDAWATIRYSTMAANSERLAPGDTLRICGNTTDSTFDLDSSWNIFYGSAPSQNAPVVILACTGGGVVRTDTSKVKITASVALTNGLIYMTEVTNLTYTYFYNLLLDGGGNGMADYCLRTANSADFDAMRFFNVRFTNASKSGILARMPATIFTGWTFTDCRIDNNGKSGTGCGIDITNTAAGNFLFFDCSIDNNDSTGVIYGSNMVMENTLVFRNGADGLRNLNNSTGSGDIITKSNFAFNTGAGISMTSSAYPVYIRNNIFRTNSTYGITFSTADCDRLKAAHIDYNCYSNNGTNPILYCGGTTPPGTHNITSDPLFTSETAGSENFTLQSNSPCINVGSKAVGY